MSRIRPWSVWRADLDPVEGREQAGTRPVLVVSSAFHLDLTGGALVSVVPLTTQIRPTWLHRVPVKVADQTSYVITEQIRTVAATRLTRPLARLSADEVAAVRETLARMIDV